ncbi:MAG: YafY family transcriptional regulator [Gammaproteobacteria bacterium]|nr:YafY family transcriptional regulator [Gammaproteobacteria bacterium]
MRRADRLFQIVTYLRGRRLATARQLAEWLEVSERTIYRDIQDLSLSGVPILGEAGVGYTLKRGFDMPPLMFTHPEIEALVFGARMVEAWVGGALGDSARDALARIAAALPATMQRTLEHTPLFVPDFHFDPSTLQRLDELRRAIADQRLLRMDYLDVEQKTSTRKIRPLGLCYWGKVWSLIAWCELRNDFRNFRIDRIQNLQAEDQRFAPEVGKRLNDFFETVGTPQYAQP